MCFGSFYRTLAVNSVSDFFPPFILFFSSGRRGEWGGWLSPRPLPSTCHVHTYIANIYIQVSVKGLVLRYQLFFSHSRSAWYGMLQGTVFCSDMKKFLKLLNMMDDHPVIEYLSLFKNVHGCSTMLWRPVSKCPVLFNTPVTFRNTQLLNVLYGSTTRKVVQHCTDAQSLIQFLSLFNSVIIHGACLPSALYGSTMH